MFFCVECFLACFWGVFEGILRVLKSGKNKTQKKLLAKLTH